MERGLEHLVGEKRLRVQGLLSVERRMLWWET